MADIQGAVVAADINDDGKIELVTTDTHGNVAAWTPQGDEIWEVHLKSLVPQASHFFDIHLSSSIFFIGNNSYFSPKKRGMQQRKKGRNMRQDYHTDI